MIILDSSVVLKLIIAEPDSPVAQQLVDGAWNRNEQIVAPLLLHMEVANTLRQRVRSALLGPDDAARYFDGFQLMPIEILPRRWSDALQLTRRALALANEFDLPASYDAHYLALAELLGCDLWTADRRLLNGVAGRLPFVRDLAAYGT